MTSYLMGSSRLAFKVAGVMSLGLPSLLMTNQSSIVWNDQEQSSEPSPSSSSESSPKAANTTSSKSSSSPFPSAESSSTLFTPFLNATRKEKLSIYDPPEPTTTVIPLPPSQLEKTIQATRHWLSSSTGPLAGGLQKAVDTWIEMETKMNDVVGKMIAREEKLIPSALYVVVTGFAGSILVKNRSYPTRFLVPPLFTVAAGLYWLPQTSNNAFSHIHSYLPPEAQKFVADAQEGTQKVVKNVQEQVDLVSKKINELKEYLEIGKEKFIANARPNFDPNRLSTSQVVKKLEEMYNSKETPGIREVIENDRKN